MQIAAHIMQSLLKFYIWEKLLFYKSSFQKLSLQENPVLRHFYTSYVDIQIDCLEVFIIIQRGEWDTL